MEVRKEIIPQGHHVYIDEKTGQPRVLPVSAETIKHYCDSGNTMLASGLKIPVPLEHQPTARPMSAADYAANQVLNNAGEVKRFEVDGGRLFGILDITHPEAAAGVKRGSIRWCSPHISSFVDGEGRAWNGVVGHVALVTRPRIHKQSPFAENGAAMSLAGMSKQDLLQPWDPKKLPKDGICLTKAGLLKDENGIFTPAYPAAFSLAFGAKLSEEDLADIAKKDTDDDGVVSKEEDEAADGDGKKPEGMGVPEAVKDQEGDSHLDEVIFHLLDVLDIPVPQHPGKNFKRNLYESLMRAVKEAATMSDTPEVPAEDPTKVPDAPASPIIQESPAMNYSLEELSPSVIAKIQDPKERATASMLFSLNQQLSTEKKRLAGVLKEKLDAAARARQARIDRIARRLPVEDRTQFINEVSGTTVQLSIGDAGQVSDPTEAVLRAYETVLRHTPDWQTDPDAKFNVSPQPVDVGGPMTDARREQVLAEVARNTGAIPGVK